MIRSAIGILGTAGLLLLGVGADFRASAQTPGQPNKPPATNAAIVPTVANTPAARNKIWTNEDLATLRKPWDVYLDQEIDAWQQAQEEAKKAAEATAAGAGAPSPKPAAQTATLTDNSPIPTTVDALQVKLNATQQEARQLATDLDTLKKTYDAETDDDRRAKLKLDIDLLERDLTDRQADIALLQARLTEVNGGVPPNDAQPANGAQSATPDQPGSPATPPSSTSANPQSPAATVSGSPPPQASASTQN